MANNTRDFHLRFFANVDLGSFKKSIDSIQSGIEKLNVSGTLKNEFDTLFKNLNKELDTFTNLANQDFNSLSDVKKLERSQKNILSLYNTLESKIDQINAKKIDPIFTDEQKSRIEEINKSIEENRKKIENANNSYDTLREQIQKIDFGDSNINKAVIDLISASKNTEKYKEALAKIQININNVKKAHGEYGQNIEDVNSKIKKNSEEITKLSKSTKEAEKSVKKLQSNNSTFNTEAIEKFDNEIRKVEETLKSFEEQWNAAGTGQLGKNSQLESFADTYGALEERLTKLKAARGKLVTDETLANLTTNNEKIREFNNLIETNKNKIGELEEENKQLTKNIEDFIAKQRQLDTSKIQEIVKKLLEVKDITKLSEEEINELVEELASINSASMASIIKTLEGLRSKASNLDVVIEQMVNGVRDFGEQSESVAKVSRQFEDLYHRATYFFSIDNSINLFKTAVREAYTAVKDLDAAMTDIAVVTDFDVGDVWETVPEYTDLANELGTTILGAYETAKLYYQQGLDNNEVMEASKETMKMARIANMDYAEATDYMTAAVRGFKLEMTDASRVNDVFSELAAISASDTQEIADALTRTASIANSAGMSLETTSAFLTQMINFATYTRVA